MIGWLRSLFTRLSGAKPAAKASEPEIWNFLLKGDRKEIGAINDALERAAGAGEIPEAAFRAVQIALDELLTNALSYGQVSVQSPAKVDIILNNKSIRAVLTYQDVNFNPFTETEHPSLHASIADREIGGLGVHLVKEMMDECVHAYKDGHNVLSVTKHF